MKNVSISLVLIVVASALLVSCDKQKKELKEQVDKYNNECPISFGEIMTINSVIFNGDEVEMKITANETISSISALNNHKDDVKENMSMSLTKETSKVLVDKIITAGTSLKTIIVGKQSGMRAEVILTAKELKLAKEKFFNMTEEQKLVTSTVLGTRIQLPIIRDEITKLVGLSLTPDALVYKYEINDEETGRNIDSAISFMKYITLSQMAQSIKGSMVGERNRQFYQALITCNQGIECEYNELQTCKNASFRISTDEIKEVLNGKWDNQPTTQDWENLNHALEELEQYYADDSVEVYEEYFDD